jgi:hypothetical protein
MLYPDWEELRPEIDALWARVSDLPSDQWTKKMGRNYEAELRTLKEKSYSFTIGRLCGNPE